MAHDDTQEDALKNINQAIAIWIDMAKESGDPILDPKGERLMPARERLILWLRNILVDIDEFDPHIVQMLKIPVRR